MHSAGIDLDEIPGFNRDLTDEFLPSAFVDHLFQFFFCLRIMADYQCGVLLAV